MACDRKEAFRCPCRVKRGESPSQSVLRRMVRVTDQQDPTWHPPRLSYPNIGAGRARQSPPSRGLRAHCTDQAASLKCHQPASTRAGDPIPQGPEIWRRRRGQWQHRDARPDRSRDLTLTVLRLLSRVRWGCDCCHVSRGAVISREGRGAIRPAVVWTVSPLPTPAGHRRSGRPSLSSEQTQRGSLLLGPSLSSEQTQRGSLLLAPSLYVLSEQIQWESLLLGPSGSRSFREVQAYCIDDAAKATGSKRHRHR